MNHAANKGIAVGRGESSDGVLSSGGGAAALFIFVAAATVGLVVVFAASGSAPFTGRHH